MLYLQCLANAKSVLSDVPYVLVSHENNGWLRLRGHSQVVELNSYIYIPTCIYTKRITEAYFVMKKGYNITGAISKNARVVIVHVTTTA